MSAVVKTLAVVIAGLLVAAMAFPNDGRLTAQNASEIRAGDPPPCVFYTDRYPCSDNLGLCTGKPQDRCEKERGERRNCYFCTSQSGQDDRISCHRGGENAWSLICELRVDPGACGRWSQSFCSWVVVDGSGSCACSEAPPTEATCNSTTLVDWDGNCRRP
jgi:hypothetical protein